MESQFNAGIDSFVWLTDDALKRRRRIIKETDDHWFDFKQGNPLRIVNLVFWSAIALMNYIQDVLVLRADGSKNYWSYATIFLSGWLIWAALTPFIFRLAARRPIQWNRELPREILRHLALATGIVVIHTLVETLIIFLLTITFFSLSDLRAFLPDYILTSIHTRFIVYFLILVVVHSRILFDRYRQTQIRSVELHSQLMESKLRALMAQLQPHFLFNAHQTIIGLMLKNDTPRAIKMITSLSDLLRKTLEYAESDTVPLKDEMEIVRLYLRIQKIRFQDNLKYDIQMDGRSGEVHVPSFILQPLVENAVKHGIEPKGQNGLITVHVERNREEVMIEVADNGNELDIRKSGWGIGLTNTVERLKQLYGNNFRFDLQKKEGDTVATLCIPLDFHPRSTHARS